SASSQACRERSRLCSPLRFKRSRERVRGIELPCRLPKFWHFIGKEPEIYGSPWLVRTSSQNKAADFNAVWHCVEKSSFRIAHSVPCRNFKVCVRLGRNLRKKE